MENSSYYFFCENVSDDIVTDGFKHIEKLQNHNVALTVIYLLFLVVGLPWNLLVVVTIVKEKLYTQPTIILLLNLVLTDLLVLLLVTPFVVVTGLAGEYVFGGSDRVRCEVCRVDLIVEDTLYLSVLGTITLLALDRFFFIHKPLHYERLVTAKRMLVAVLVMWGMCAFFTLLELAIVRNVRFDPLLLNCEWDTEIYFHILSIMLILLPYLVILVCNIRVICIVLKNIRAIYKVQKPSLRSEKRMSRQVFNSRMKHTRNKKQLHLMEVFGAIIFFNSMSWLPLVILVIVAVVREAVTFTIPNGYVLFALILFRIEVVIYPILETTLISDIRNPMKKMVTCVSCRKKDLLSGDLPKRQGEGEWHCGCYGDDERTECGCLQFCNAILLPHSVSHTSTPNSHTSSGGPAPPVPSKDHTPSPPSKEHTLSKSVTVHTPSCSDLGTHESCDHPDKP